MAERPRAIAKALVEDGKTVVELLSDGRYRLVEDKAETLKAKLFPSPADPRPNTDGQKPAQAGFKFFAPGPQGARMPNGLWNSSAPLPGHKIEYAEADAKGISDRRRLGGGGGR